MSSDEEIDSDIASVESDGEIDVPNLLNSLNNVKTDDKKAEEPTDVSKPLTFASLFSADDTDVGQFDASVKEKLSKLSKKTNLKVASISNVASKRLEGAEAYKLAKKEIDEFKPQINELKNKRHVNFSEYNKSAKVIDTGDIVSKFSFDKKNPMENQISQILSKIDESNDKMLKKAENSLEENNLSYEELKARTAHLAKLRSQIFFDQKKQARAKRIKSKTYHKHQKRALKNEIRKISGEDETEKEAELHKEVVSMRLRKNKKNSSKFLKTLLKLKKTSGSKSLGSARKQFLLEQIQKEEEMRQKLKNMFDDNASSSSDDDDNDKEVETIQETGIHAMEFMKKGKEKRIENATEHQTEETPNGKLVHGRGKFGTPGKAEKESQPVDANLSAALEEKFQVVHEDDVVVDMSQALNFKINNLEFDLGSNKNQHKKRLVQEATKESSTPSMQKKVPEKVVQTNPVDRKFSKQRELMKRAFANAGAVEIEESESEPEEPGNKEENMAGWGSWTGADFPTPKKKKRKKKSPTTAQKRVRINDSETRKVQEKYAVRKLPYPFKTVEEYERSRMLPIGQEWNTAEAFDKLIRPSVTVRAGDVIKPMQLKADGDDSSSDTD